MSKTELITHLSNMAKRLDLPDDALDSLVHDMKSQEASAINNEGIEGQLDYLIESAGGASEQTRRGIEDQLRNTFAHS
ncbi:MAG: hypothetical protein AB1411_16540 [Nitrospirota bacterium]